MSETLAMEPQSWNLAGAGNVGQALLDMVAKPEVAARFGLLEQPDFVLRKGGWHKQGPDGDIVETDREKLPNSPILFVAMPSTPDYRPTLSLIRQQLERGDMVITAEKAVLAKYGPELADLPGRLGYWAAYGGGTKIPDRQKLDMVDPENLREMYANPTATFSFLFSSIAHGLSHEEAADLAIDYKFAEPNAKGFFDIFGEEEVDTLRKTILGLKFTLPAFRNFDPKNVVQHETTRDHIMEALSDPWKYAYLTAMFPEAAEEMAHYMTEGRKGGFDIRDAGYLVISGLMPVDKVHPLADQYPYQLPRQPLKLFKTVPGATAAYYAAHGPADGSSNDGWVFTIGSGAGADTTANAMLDNSKALRAA